MLAIGTIARMLRHHRLLGVGVGLAIVLGVAALNAHASLPEHHHHHGEETMCAASLSIAVAAGALALAGRDPLRPLPRLLPLARRCARTSPEMQLAARVLHRSRAGPPTTVTVLRR